jgi:hypothetical protein
MLFLHELAVRLTAAVAAQKRPDVENYLEQQEGEELVGFVSDRELLALIAMRDDQDAELLLKPKLRRRGNAATGPARAINQHLQTELQRMFVDWEDVPLGLRRKGNELIVVKFGKKGPIFLRALSFTNFASVPVEAHA